ncbi:amidohydrolase family protein [Peribacillus butanolivorans]|uniref:amidohydrolase family protein n=1 Tax=Peribacillus butanolivorans TaxID=421767 RepID=UPI0036DA12A5
MFLKNATFLSNEMKFETGDLYITDGTIHFESTINSEETIDCTNYLILPGLINAHFHSYSPLTRGLVKDMGIQDWCNDSKQGKIQQLFFDYIDNIVSKEDFVWAAKKSYLDMIRCGVTFVSDSDPGDYPKLLSKAMNDIGIRGIIDVYDAIDDYLESDQHVLFGTHLLEEEDITEDTLQFLMQKKNNHHIKMTHCMENRWRNDLVKNQFNKSSVELYDQRSLLDNKTVLFHGVYLSNSDFEIIAKYGSSIVHCPVSNLATGAGIANIGSMLQKGINVCLGTDYGETNMWETMRMSYYLLKVNQPVEEFSAENIFKMAIPHGAKAYGLEREVGQIQEGYKADLVFIKKEDFLLPSLETEHYSTLLHNLLLYLKEESIKHVMIDGKWIMKERQIQTIDQQKVEQKYKEVVNGFIEYVHQKEITMK